jgi:putative transposase
MLTLFRSFLGTLRSCFQTRAALQLEILALRHQINVLRRSQRGRLRLTEVDRLLWAGLLHLWSGWRSALIIVKPETVIAWHRRGFRQHWTWKNRQGGPGRPQVPRNVRDLIWRMSLANPLWGAPRIHGELLKLGIELSQATVAKYIERPRKPPSQTWRTFLHTHLKQLVSTDFFVVPTVNFRILFVFVVLAHYRRRVIHFNVTAHPTSEWKAQQIAEAFPWDTAPRYLLHDRDSIYGDVFQRRVRGMAVHFIMILLVELRVTSPVPCNRTRGLLHRLPRAFG